MLYLRCHAYITQFAPLGFVIRGSQVWSVHQLLTADCTSTAKPPTKNRNKLVQILTVVDFIHFSTLTCQKTQHEINKKKEKERTNRRKSAMLTCLSQTILLFTVGECGFFLSHACQNTFLYPFSCVS